MADSTFLKCVVVTPEKAVLDEPADFVALPMYDGELGIAPDRLPLIGRLGFGELRIVKGAKTHSLYVDGGFVQVRGNVVTVLTSKAVETSDLKPEAAIETLRSTIIEVTPERQEAHRKAQQRARAQLRIVEKYKEE